MPAAPRPTDDRLLAELDLELGRLRAAAAAGPGAVVPTCPDWTMADLVRHVAEVYLHKTHCIVEGAEPGSWPPAGLADEDPLALLDRAYDGLRRELTTRDREDPAGSWYEPDQTVGFWVRRMAHETVVHRIDAELAAGLPVTPVAPDIALDGIDELFVVHVAYSVRVWGDYFTDVLDAAPPHTYEVAADGAGWRLRTAPGVFSLDEARPDSPAEVRIAGDPTAVLRWVWNRGGDVEVDGPPSAVAVVRGCIATATS